MNRKRIQRDYENVDYVDEKGKVRTKVVYKGAHYVPESPEKLQKFKIFFTLVAAIVGAATLLPLFFPITPMRTMYVAVPFVGQVFPLFFIISGAYKALTAKLPYNEETKAAVTEAAKIGSFVGMGLALVSAAGFIALWAMGKLSGADFIAGASIAACLIGYGLLLLLLRGLRLKTADPIES